MQLSCHHQDTAFVPFSTKPEGDYTICIYRSPLWSPLVDSDALGLIAIESTEIAYTIEYGMVYLPFLVVQSAVVGGHEAVTMKWSDEDGGGDIKRSQRVSEERITRVGSRTWRSFKIKSNFD